VLSGALLEPVGFMALGDGVAFGAITPGVVDELGATFSGGAALVAAAGGFPAAAGASAESAASAAMDPQASSRSVKYPINLRLTSIPPPIASQKTETSAPAAAQTSELSKAFQLSSPR